MHLGIYISLGYSEPELVLIKKKVPEVLIERSGFVGSARAIASDIASRLQFALERILPKVRKLLRSVGNN